MGGTTLVYGCVWGVPGGPLPHCFMEERIVQCGMVCVYVCVLGGGGESWHPHCVGYGWEAMTVFAGGCRDTPGRLGCIEQ